MRKLTRIAAIFIVVASFFAWSTPVSAADTDWSGADWTISTGTTISGVQFNIGTFTISSGVTATVDSVVGMVEIHARTVNIEGTLTATGQGYATNSGPGAGTSCATKFGAGGGGYGGAGGNGDSGILGGGTYGSSLAPIDMGSGGGTSGSTPGGSGGGAIIIHCIGTLTIGASGVIEADGNPGSGLGNDASGGGAGGSIYLTANAISGTGSIHANGGAGDSTKYLAGGGGGGRIVIHLGSGSFGGTTSAVGGTATSPATPGGAGTDLTDDVLWRTYKDSGYADDEDVFNEYVTEHTVYVSGTGFPNSGIDYTIVFWDALGVNVQADTPQAGPDISSLYTFKVAPDDPAGTWYVSAYVGTAPASHSDATNLKADYAFKATTTAIPEFSTVMGAIGVAGLCCGMYFWMRKRYQRRQGA